MSRREAEATHRALIEHAVLAPSGHNSQPWRFRILDDGIELLADRRRALPVVDPHDRELTISCGAALETLVVAARHHRRSSAVDLLPERDEPELLARVRLHPDPAAPSEDDERSFRAISQRHTNRAPYTARAIPPAQLDRWEHVVRERGARLCVLEGALRRNAADMIAAGARAQAHDPAFRRELAAWVHPNRSSARDGMPGYSHGLSSLASRAFPWVVRTLDWGKSQGAKDRALALDAPLLAVIGTDEDTPRAWLATGRALQSLLLLATSHGVSAAFLNQPIEVPSLRRELAGRLPSGMTHPQLLLRLGYGPEARATPRRAIADVLETR